MLELQSLSIQFNRYTGLVRRTHIPVLTDVSLTLARGEMLALIGASGSGKSILAQAILGLLPENAETAGTVWIDGSPYGEKERRRLCNRALALVPQSLSYLDPLARCGQQIAWSAHRAGHEWKTAHQVVGTALARYNLSSEVRALFPHELSGGMARRTLLAIATAGKADLMIADEPTSGLDESNAAIVLGHLRALANDGHAVMVITHDLAGALGWVDRVAIIRQGRMETTVEAGAFQGDGDALPSPYARALWQALPQNGFGAAL